MSPGAQVHFPAWIPLRHPMTGRRTTLLCNVTDRIITTEQARALNALYNLRAAPGSLRMSI